ncbi:MAG: hypothetical protein ACYTHM_23725 [Planctomycetota bacterium]|jgi:tetratricopeptide (TPR) repeat protein
MKWIFIAPKPQAQVTGQPTVPKKGSSLNRLPEMARARKDLKPVILYFYFGENNSPWGRLCEGLNKKAFCNTAIVKLSKGYLCLAADFNRLHTSLRIGFAVKKAPTVFFSDAFGKVHFTLTGNSLNRRSIQGAMNSTLRRNKAAVKVFKKKKEAWDKKVQEADQLLFQNEFEKAEKILAKLAKEAPTPELAAAAQALRDEIAFGVLFVEGVKAFDAKQFEQAEKKLKAVAEAKGKNRWASHALRITKTLPAARLYHEALKDLAEGRSKEGVRKLEKVVGLPDAGKYTELAASTLRDHRAKEKETDR